MSLCKLYRNDFVDNGDIFFVASEAFNDIPFINWNGFSLNIGNSSNYCEQKSYKKVSNEDEPFNFHRASLRIVCMGLDKKTKGFWVR